MTRWKWKAIAFVWTVAVVVVLTVGLMDQVAQWTGPEPDYSNARTISTPVGELTVKTDGILAFPGHAIALVVRGRPGQDGVRAIEEVRYTLTARDSSQPTKSGAAPLVWTQAGATAEARVESLFPNPSGSHVWGESLPLGEYHLVVEFRIGDRTVAASPPLGLRVEKPKHH
jgi:hypothetical protein